MGSWRIVDAIQEQSDYFVANILESHPDQLNYSNSVIKTKMIYDSCIQSKQQQINYNKAMLQVQVNKHILEIIIILENLVVWMQEIFHSNFYF